MTEIVGQITSPTDIDAIQANANALQNLVQAPVAPTTFVFFAGFDGTNNIGSDPSYSGDAQSTAVYALYEQCCRLG